MEVDADGTIFGELVPSPVFHPCSLTDKVSVSYTEYMGSIPIRGTFTPFCGCIFAKALPGSGLVVALLDLGRAFLVS